MTKNALCLLSLLLLAFFSLVNAEPASGMRENAVVEAGIIQLIESVQARDVEAVARCIKYPLMRRYPIPTIESEAELVERYDEVFDEALCSAIAHSRLEDWSLVGWRGFMLGDGLVWTDYDGKVRAINVSTEQEKAMRAALIEADRGSLHPDLRDFEEPILKWDTDSLRLRVDRSHAGYRLAVWEAGGADSKKPDRVVEQGKLIREGSGGNHYFEFRADELVYECWVEMLGGESEYDIGKFSIRKGDELLVSEAAIRAY